MGGTTAKCALVENGRFSVESIYYAGGYVKGFPIKSSVINIVEVGSGGGSIAWLDPQNRLHVGPQSAGSTPGPACYGNGGTEPTVTDANLVLGRLNPDRFLGGELKLDVDAARQRGRARSPARSATPGRDGLIRMADGIIALATVIMAGAIKQISVEHGLDPREFVLFCYGGGGPLHASALARELSIPTVVIPPEPGNFSAVGMLLADARLDLSKTFTGVLNDSTVASLQDAVRRDGSGSARRAGARLRRRRRRVRAPRRDALYRPAPQHQGADLGPTIPRRSAQAFDRDYKRRYGHADARAAAEFQALHLSAFTRLRRPELERLPRAQAADASRDDAPGLFRHGHGTLDAQVYDRTALAPGFKGEGPALIEEYGSTTLIWPGDRFEVGELGEIRITIGAE